MFDAIGKEEADSSLSARNTYAVLVCTNLAGTKSTNMVDMQINIPLEMDWIRYGLILNLKMFSANLK